MTNLTDLLPAGAGGKQVSFTASGTITQGKPVILNTAGTVTEVAETSVSESIGSSVNFAGSNTGYIYSTFDSTNNKVIVINTDSTSTATEVRVGTVSGTSISFGSASTTSDSYSNVCDYDPDGQVVLFVYTRSSNNYLYAIAATISGTTVSFGSEQYLGVTGAPQAYDLKYIESGKFLLVLRDNGNSGYGTGMVLTVSGTSISYGSKYVFNSASINNGSAASGTNSAQFVITYGDNGSSSRGSAIVATISGTAISYGSQLLFTSGSTVGNSGNVRYISSVDRFVCCYKDSGNSGYGTAIVLSQSGTSVSTAGSPVVFASANTEHASGVYNSTDDKYTVFYRRNSSPAGSKYIVGTVSTTSISFGSISQFDANTTRNYERYATTYDTNANRVVCFYYRDSSPYEGYAVVLQNAGVETNLTATNFIGIADEAISDTASGNITIKGGVASNGLSSLTPNSTYYVQNDGSLSTTSSSVTAGKALSATSINLDYSS